ncbi:winged helix-turn-helix domain-containing protein [Dokdonella fugitiva]|uniref:winged helix-turn-helix domain-containing protein n=1 Tax=Dokdonella fugitiva TaxID=328517 RepID=UPI0015FC3D17|nr:winged helix-turn-helix domain-containing protein [Dokdonella fugitiva]MBA8885271.1 DNA-binding winged helix-turn-helix (wHTH) protein/tetratricopeptide (TPR) repeat protein [Dokdonella fugitiva]
MSHPVYLFGEYRVDPLARELHRGSELLALSPKVFDCLVYLIEHRDRAVGRDELIAAVWGKLDVSDTLLGQTLLKARRAVGDDGNEQNAIRTIPRFGYRWIRELETARTDEPDPRESAPSTPPSAPAATTATEPPAEAVAATTAAPPAGPHRRVAILAGAAAFVLATLALAWLLPPRGRDALPPKPAQVASNDALVVLPATVESSEEWAWLRLGLMDLVASRLRQAGQVVAPSDNVVAAWRTASAGGGDPATVVRSLTGAREVIVPQVARVADDWLVQIELRENDGGRRTIEARGSDPIETARNASDQLLVLLGKSPVATHDDVPVSVAGLLQRTEASLLGDDFATARRLIEAAPAAVRATPAIGVRLAQIDYRSGRLDAARGTLEQVLAQVSAETDPVLRAQALHMLGALAVREDRSADAVPIFEEAIRLTESRHEPVVVGQAYTGLAAALVNLWRFDEAASALARARIALTLANDTLSLARVDANEGILNNNRGRHAEALPVLQRAADRFRHFGALNDLALTVTAQIKAQIALLDASGAVATSESLLPQRAQLVNARTRGNFDLQRARALAAVGRLTDARRLLDELRRDASLADQAELPGSIAAESARLQLAAGDAAQAAESARRAVAALPTTDEAHVRAQAWLTLVRALLAGGHAGDARDQCAQFQQWTKEHGDMPSVIQFARLAEAELARAAQRREDADRSFAAAFDEAERWGVPHDLAIVVSSWGTSLIADRELDRASEVVGRVARWAEQDYDCALLQAQLYGALHQTDAWRAALARVRALAGERTVPSGAAIDEPATRSG